MNIGEQGAVLINERNPLVGVKETLAGYANIVESEAFNLPSPHITSEEI